MSVSKALLLNVGSAMTSFIGLYIALSVATDTATQQWITAVAGGLFLYVGLADMVSVTVRNPVKLHNTNVACTEIIFSSSSCLQWSMSGTRGRG